MGKRYTVNGIPVPEGLTEAEYQRVRRSPHPIKTLHAMGKKPDERWLKMVKEGLKFIAKTF